jgi:hypothetical protein
MMDDIQAMKFFTLEMVIGLASIVAGFSLGDVADQLLAWWDSYSTKTWFEGQDKDTGKYDTDGTAAEYDYYYHWGVLGVSYLLFSGITIGGYWFGLQFMKWSDPTEELCQLGKVSSTVKNNILSVFGSVKTLEQCYEKVPALMASIDFNKNGILDRCEDATLLYSLGNT